MPSRLTNRYQGYRRLEPSKLAEEAGLFELAQSLCEGCSVFHVMNQIPEQTEDLYTLLCDDEFVISFEVPRGKLPLSAVDVVKAPIGDYRSKLRQGKHRIRLDMTLESVRALLCS